MKLFPVLCIALAASAAFAADPQPSFEKPKVAAFESLSDPVPKWMVRWELARALVYAEKYEEALAEYETLCKERPEMVSTFRHEMLAPLVWGGDQESAMQMLQALGDERDEEENILMADLLVFEENYAEAVALYKKALEAAPDNDSVRLKLAEVLSWQKEYEASIAQYKHLLEMHPDDADLHKKLGMTLVWAGDHLAAIEELQKALELSEE